MTALHHAFSCVDVPTTSCTLDELMRLVDKARDISIATFKRALGKELVDEIRATYGYGRAGAKGLTLEGDYHIQFKTVRHRGQTAYVMVHSAIEHVYLPVPNRS